MGRKVRLFAIALLPDPRPRSRSSADLPISLSSHVSVAPQLRVHLIARTDDPNVTIGLSPVVWRPALALIATF
jgi:hypothetical protein